MPRNNKIPKKYNLTKEFRDKYDNCYPRKIASKLRFWPEAREASQTDKSQRPATVSDSKPQSVNYGLVKLSYGEARIGKKRYDSILARTPPGGTDSSALRALAPDTGKLSFSTLGDGASPVAGSDTAISISLWVKPRKDSDPWDLGGTVKVGGICKGFLGASTKAEYRIEIRSDRVRVYLEDNASNAQYVLEGCTAGIHQPKNWSTEEFTNIVFSYRGGVADITNMWLFKNLESVVNSRTATGTYVSMNPDFSAPLAIGVANYGTKAPAAGHGPNPSLAANLDYAEVALWDYELATSFGGVSEEMRAIYNATRDGLPDMSGYLNNPPKTIIHVRDNATGSYPRISRTTGYKLEEASNPFDDTRALDSNKNGKILAPFGMSKVDVKRYGSNFVATPNQFSTGANALAATGKITPGMGPPIDRSFNQYGKFTPFDESRIYLEDTDFYKVGTPNSIVPGFSSALKDKIQIKINIDSTSDQILSRWSGYLMPTDVPVDEEGELAGQRFTGMRYYSFNEKSWIKKGIVDPVNTGFDTPPTAFFLVNGTEDGNKTTTNFYNGLNFFNGAGYEFVNPYNHKMYQFGMSPQTGYFAETIEDLKDMGYDKIGAATMAGLGPNMSPRYFARPDQRLRMSDYISHPFLLEKAVIEIPVTAQRKNGNFHPADTTYNKKVNGGNRDIDNYVFFLYKQSSGRTSEPSSRLKPQIVNDLVRLNISGSRRNIIMSASISFYNSNAFNEEIKNDISKNGLPHNPAFAHDFNAQVSGSGNASEIAGMVSAFTGTLRIEMTPAVANGGRRGGSRFPVYGFDGSRAFSAYPTMLFQDFWTGGTSFDVEGVHTKPFSGSVDLGGQNTNSGMNNFAQEPMTSMQLGYGNSFHGMWRDIGTSFKTATSEKILISEDQRPLRNFTGYNDQSNIRFLPNYPSESSLVTCRGISKTPTGSNTKETSTSTVSPYILLPGDELVLGIDAGISCLPMSGVIVAGEPANTQYTFDPNIPNIYGNAPLDRPQEAISGSFMRIKKGSASITLYGSMISAGKERLFELNQNLTTNAVHEALHFDNPVVDQFDIHDKYAYSGSYIDNLVFGSIDADQKEFEALESLGGDAIMLQNLGPAIATKLPRGVYGSLGTDSANGVEKYYSESPADTFAMSGFGGAVSDPYGLSWWNVSTANKSSRNSLLRANKLLDKSERWYDTIMPDIKDFAERSGMSTEGGIGHGELKVLSKLNGIWNETPFRGAGDQEYDANKKAKPYDTRVERNDFTYVSLLFQHDNARSAHIHNGIKPFENAAASFPNKHLVDTLLFGRGYKIVFQGSSASGNKIKFFPPFATGSASTANSTPYGACGFLYGIQNTRKDYSSMYFRYNKFGQFRDMLEQRKDGKFSKSSSPSREVDAPIQCVFVQRENGYIESSPYQTDSGNMSTECTASAPFNESGFRAVRYPSLIALKRDERATIDSADAVDAASYFTYILE